MAIYQKQRGCLQAQGLLAIESVTLKLIVRNVMKTTPTQSSLGTKDSDEMCPLPDFMHPKVLRA